jgi:thiol-disulfide isomerase/thioredoxin
VQCVAEVPLLKQLNAKYGKDVVFVGISVDTNLDRLDKFIKDKGISWPQVGDGKEFSGAVPKLYRPNGTPTLYVVDSAGRIAAKLGTAEKVEESLQTVLGTQ